MATVAPNGPERELELGKLYADRCDFKQAVVHYKKAFEEFRGQREYQSSLKCINYLLRAYAEMEDRVAIEQLKTRLQELIVKEKVELDSRTHYTLGLCASYEGRHSTALEYLEKALATALAKDDKEGMCYAINGISIVYTTLNRYEDALKEIYNLQVFFQVLELNELKISSQILNGHILRELGKYDAALDVFWKCYDDLRDYKNFYLYICLLYAIGVTYLDSGHPDLARMYLQLAKRTADPENLKHSLRKIDNRLAQLGEESSSDYDIVFDTVNKQIKERKKGTVDFRNQFILLDLLRLFMKNPGEVYSKEAIVQKIWRQEYDPGVHDNKLYVTIKRLRKMIEPDFDRPKYIFRAKNGYYLNKNVKVLMQK